MVLTRSTFAWFHLRPQPIRITGLSVAIALNLFVLLLLSLPDDSPFVMPAAKPASKPIDVEWLRPEQPKPLPPVPDMPTPPERVVRATPQPTPAPVAPIVDHAAFAIPVEIIPSPVIEATPVDSGFAAAAPNRVRALFTPAPSYPGPALRAAHQGVVVLRVLVGIDGRAQQVVIDETSGYRTLDRAAVEQVLQRWRFEPARDAGRVTSAWVLVPVEFTIQR